MDGCVGQWAERYLGGWMDGWVNGSTLYDHPCAIWQRAQLAMLESLYPSLGVRVEREEEEETGRREGGIRCSGSDLRYWVSEGEKITLPASF